MPIVLFLCILVAYLIGSVSFAIVVSRWMKLPDPRTYGSHNPGTTNVLRTGSKKAAMFTLFGDAIKGVLTVLLARFVVARLGLSEEIVAASAVAVVVGHIWPLYFKFRGGKGVATAGGVLLALHVGMGLILVAVWLSVAKISKTSSLAALVAILFAPLVAWFLFPEIAYRIAVSLIAVLLVACHRENIQNLLSGQERKIERGKG